MKHYTYIFTLLVLSNSFLSNSQQNSYQGAKLEYNPDKWELVFNDEFTDPSKARLQSFYDLDGPRCTQRTLYTWDRINVVNGNLVLSSQYTGPITNSQDHPICQAYPHNDRILPDYAGGGICSKLDYNNTSNPCSGWVNGFKYGMFEVRCKFPTEHGTWPAWWMSNGADEIDIFEFEADKPHELTTNLIESCGGNDIPTSAGYVIDYNSPCNLNLYPNDDYKESCQKKHLFERNLTNEFHTYTVVWTPNRYTYYIDGRELRTETRYVDNGCEQKFRLNLGVTGNNGQVGFQYAEFLVDYIRIYKQKDMSEKFMYTYDASTIATYPDVVNRINSLDVGTGNHLFYNSTNGWIEHRVKQAGTNYVNDPLPKTSNLWKVNGDMKVGTGNQVFYRGSDGRIQTYYYSNSSGSYAHGWVDDLWNYTPSKISSQAGALAVGEGNQLFYRGEDNWMHSFYWNGDWNHAFLPQGPNSWKVAGDVVVGEGNQVFYRGADGRMQIYYWKNSTQSWNHGWVDDYWNTSNYKVSSQPGAIEVGAGNQLFYRGTDNRMHGFHYASGDWNHFYLPYEIASQKCMGDIAIGEANYIYYRGADGKMQMYYYQVMTPGLEGHWFHTWVNEEDPMSSFEKLSTHSSIDINIDQGINQPVYRGLFGDPTQYIHSESTGKIVDLTCGYNSDVTHFKNNEQIAAGQENSKIEPIIEVYPNPNTGEFTVKLPSAYSKNVTSKIYDTQNRLIYTIDSIEGLEQRIDLSTQENGIYFMVFYQNNELISQQRIIVQH